MEGGEGGEEGEEGGGGGVTGGSAEARAHRARRRTGARAKLPNKPMDWQVRISYNSHKTVTWLSLMHAVTCYL